MRKAPVFLAGWLAVWLQAAPAQAWGPLTHGLVGDRAYAELVPRMPWLAPHRDAFLWGAVGADVQEAPGVSETSRERAHAGYTLRALWREARASRDHEAQAFVVGWAAHEGADDTFDAFTANKGRAWLDGLARSATDARTGSEKPPGALLEWAVDAALLPRSNHTLEDVGRAAFVHAGTPESTQIAKILGDVLALDDAAYDAWARLVAMTCLGGSDRYLDERASALRVTPWTEMARDVAARQALGDLTPWVTRAVRASVERARSLSENAPAPPHQKETP